MLRHRPPPSPCCAWLPQRDIAVTEVVLRHQGMVGVQEVEAVAHGHKVGAQADGERPTAPCQAGAAQALAQGLQSEVAQLHSGVARQQPTQGDEPI